jgi:hypothetical protein
MRLLQTEHIKSGTHKKDGNATLTNGTYKIDKVYSRKEPCALYLLFTFLLSLNLTSHRIFDTSKTYIEKCISKYNYNPDRVNETHVILINVDMQEIFINVSRA